MATIEPIDRHLRRCGAWLARKATGGDVFVCEAGHEVTGKEVALAAAGPWCGSDCPRLVERALTPTPGPDRV